MTAQASDRLDNRNESVDFGELALYEVVTGDIYPNYGRETPYRFQAQPIVPKDCSFWTFLLRGYIAEFTLAPDGSLTLDAYLFPAAPNGPRQVVDERLLGDFWLVMRSDFTGPNVYVPFRDGIVVAVEHEWVIEGSNTLESLKHPKRPKKAENIPLHEPEFIGTVSRVKFYGGLDEEPYVEFDREIPRLYHWCEVQIRRANVPIVDTKLDGLRGGGAGPWALRPPIESMVQVGNQVFAIARRRNADEIKQQGADY